MLSYKKEAQQGGSGFSIQCKALKIYTEEQVGTFGGGQAWIGWGACWFSCRLMASHPVWCFISHGHQPEPMLGKLILQYSNPKPLGDGL